LSSFTGNSKKEKELRDLRDQIYSFDCPLKKLATNMVFSAGNPDSKVMLIGEAPGQEEDVQGLPFVGQSGQLLDKMLKAIGLTREKNAYIANVVNWRPPGNRPPTAEEISAFLPFLKRHISIISPKVLVLLGATAMKAVLQIESALSRARKIWHMYEVNGDYIKTLVTFHPSYLLRCPSQKEEAWQDFMRLQAEVESSSENA
jgi:DNA polymerase